MKLFSGQVVTSTLLPSQTPRYSKFHYSLAGLHISELLHSSTQSGMSDFLLLIYTFLKHLTLSSMECALPVSNSKWICFFCCDLFRSLYIFTKCRSHVWTILIFSLIWCQYNCAEHAVKNSRSGGILWMVECFVFYAIDLVINLGDAASIICANWCLYS